MKKLLLILSLLFAIQITYSQNGGYALKFNGTTDYIEFSTTSDLTVTDVTIEAWINPSSVSANQIFSWVKRTATVNVLEFRLINGKLDFGINDGGWGSVTGTTNIETGKWTHVAITKSGSNIVLYINGKQEATGTINKNPVVNQLELGYYQDDASEKLRYFSGTMDEVRIWTTARTIEQIKANMFKELVGNEANLVAYYKMSNGTGTTLTDNKSSGTNNGTINGATWKASGCFTGPRNALDFDGTNDYVDCGSSITSLFTGTNVITLEAWVYLTSSSGAFKTIVGNYYNPGQMQFLLRIDAGLPTFFVSNGSYTYLRPVNNIALNTWTHLAGTWDGTTMKFYINGKLEVSGNYSGNFPNLSSSVKIGYNDLSEFWVGKIDEVRIWNSARTESQIRENMMSTLVSNEAGLVAYYRFDHYDGTTLYDLTSNANHGTLTNMETSDWVASTAFNTWIGSENSAWSTAGNWSSSSFPGATDNVGLYKWDLGNESTISGTPTVNHLLFSSTASPTLSSNFTVNGNLLLEKNLDLTGQTIFLGANGYLVEGSNRLLGASGNIRIEKYWGTLSNHNPAGLGLVLTTSEDFGWHTIIRGHTEQTQGSSKSILRYYKIIEEAKTKQPKLSGTEGNDAMSITLKFNYLDSELNGLNENTLTLFNSTDNGTTWTPADGSLNTTENTVTISGLSDINWTLWTLGSTSSPLPVELVSFNVQVSDKNVHLNWQTATEQNNYGFEIERSQKQEAISETWEKIGFVAGHGNSNSPKEYSFTDETITEVKYSYRLKQIDNDGKFTYSDVVNVERENIPTEFTLYQNYPNPFKPSTTIKFGLPKDGIVTLEVYNLIGEKVATLVNKELTAGYHTLDFNASNLSSGIYLYKITAGEFTSTKKFVLMK